MSDKLAKAICERESALRAGRSTLESLWQQIARYIIPSEATFTEEVTPGVERNRSVLDSTAPRALEQFASFLHTLLNNPASKWMNMRVGDSDATDLSSEMKKWKDRTEKRMINTLSNDRANFYSSVHQVYLDEGAFGTGVMYIDIMRGRLGTRHYHLADCILDEDAYGMVDTIFRRFKLTPRQAKQRWPDADLGPPIEKAKAGSGQEVVFMHAVVPSTDEWLLSLLSSRDRKLVERAAFASVWLNHTDQKTIRVGIFEEMPYMTPRWYKTRGDKYGRSPGMTVLPDVRMVNRMMETILRGAEKLVDPPLIVRDGGLISPMRLFPGAITFTDGEVKIEPLIPPGASRIEYGEALLKMRQEAIRDGYFVPLFVSPESPRKTATQVLQEVDERNRAVSPMLVRQQNELFNPLLRRVFGLMARNGMIEPPPEDVETISLEYVSPVMASQKQTEALGTLRIIESLLPWAQVDPNVFDAFESDEVAKIVHAGSGAPATMLATSARIKSKREARAQAQQQQAMMTNLIAATEAGAKVTAANSKGR